MTSQANEDPIENKISFEVGIQPWKCISVIGSRFVIEKWYQYEYEEVAGHCEGKEYAIEYMHSRPTFKWGVNVVEAMFTRENADEYFNDRLYQYPLN